MEEINYIKELLKIHLKDNDLRTEGTEENDTFFINTCHICHCLDKSEKPLKRCSSCNMISYCGTEHQAQHWPTHKKLCKIIKHIISTNGGYSIFGNTKGLDKKIWVKLKMNTMLIVSLKLGRKLTSSERGMFLFPRICFICHESNPQALTNCFDCGNSCFCNEHILDARHKIICPSFTLCYKLSLLKNITSNISISEIVCILLDGNPINCIPFAYKNVELSTMIQFIKVFFRQVIDERRQNNVAVSSDFWQVFIAEYFTRPLTLLSAIKLINYELETELIIHIIGSDYVEVNGIYAWEILFHLMPKIEKLTIVFIGPELVNNEINTNFLCKKCKKYGKFIDIVIDNRFYHEFTNKVFKRPNLIIGYNLGISENENPGTFNDTWQLTILKIAEINVPFVMTCYTEGEAHKDHKRICNFLNNVNKNVFSSLQPNRFASLTPLRDFETEGVFYQNDHVIVYNNWQTNKS